MIKNTQNIGVILYTYNRVDDAKINMEIIRNVWKKDSFNDVKIVHSFNGLKEWYPEKYLEDSTIRIKNSWHFQGAADLIDAGVKKMQQQYPNIRYVIVLAADSWIINQEYLRRVINKMNKERLYLASCAWGRPGNNNIFKVGVATDFFIVDLEWATKYKLFPIRYKEFHKRYKEIIAYQTGGNIMLEKLFLTRYLQSASRDMMFDGIAKKYAVEKLLILKEREPIHLNASWERKMYWKNIGLLTHHSPTAKKKILKNKNIIVGKNIKKLLTKKDLTYYNSGFTTGKYCIN